MLRIAGCSVLDLSSPGRARPDVDIHIEGDRIAEITPAGSVPLVVGEQTLPGAGRLAVPGLINAHTHSPENLLRGVSRAATLEPWLIETFTGRDFDAAELGLAARLGATEMLASGVTATLDHVAVGGLVDSDALGAVAEAYAGAGLRVGLAPMLEDRDLLHECAAARDPALAKDLPRREGSANGLTRLLEEAFARWDGSAEGRIRVVAGPSSLMWASDALLERSAQLARERDRPLHLHAAETWLQERVVSARLGESTIAALDRRGLLGPRTSLAHCVWVSDADIALLAERGTVVVHNPVSNLRLGSGIAPIARMLAAGVTVAVGSDGAASNDSQDLPEALKLAALLANRDGAGMVGRAELLAMGTTAGARAAGWDAELGRLEPGALADLALLDLDAPAFAALNDAVDQWILAGGARAARTVIVGGRVVVEDGIPVAIDAPSVAAELRERLAAREDVAAASRHAALAALQGFIERTGWHRPGGKA